VRKNIKTRLYKALDHISTQANTSSLWLSIMGTLLGIGFLVGDSTSFKYFPFIKLLNHNIWAAILFAYAAVKFLQAVQSVPYWVTIATSVIGAWVWNYMIFSFIFLDPQTMAPVEVLLFFPVVCEVFDLAMDIVRWRNPLYRGKHIL
jgi:hypothetical protein